MALKIGADILWEPTACSMPWICGGFWWLQMYRVWFLCLKKSSSSGPDWLKSKQFIRHTHTHTHTHTQIYGEEAWRNKRIKKKFLKLHNGSQQEKKAHLTCLGYYLDILAWVGTGLWDSEKSPIQFNNLEALFLLSSLSSIRTRL